MNGMKHAAAWGLVVLMTAMASGCGKKETAVYRAFDRQNMKMIVLSGEKAKTQNFYEPEFVVLGGGMGGIAAALAIVYTGRSATLIEESDHITGCFTGSGPFAFPENPLIESSGSSKMYRDFRKRIQDWYASHSQTPPPPPSGFSTVSGLGFGSFCFSTEAAQAVIDDMIKQQVDRGSLKIFTRQKVVGYKDFNEKVTCLLTVDLDKKVVNQFTGFMFIDATEHGDLFPLLGIPTVSGRESKADTGEPHAAEQADSLSAYETASCADSVKMSRAGACLELAVQTGAQPDAPGKYTFRIMKEPRRILGLDRVTEQDISAASNPGPRAKLRKDSVGIGFAPIELTAPDGSVTVVGTKPFQIPLGALLPRRYNNIIVAGHCLGATHVAASAFTSPEVEWMLGEAAGFAASYAVGLRIPASELLNNARNLQNFQNLLVTQYKIPIYWYDDVDPGDRNFPEAQAKPFTDLTYTETAKTLHYE